LSAKENTNLQSKLIGTDQQKIVRRERLKISEETKVSRAIINDISNLSPDEILTEYFGAEYKGWENHEKNNNPDYRKFIKYKPKDEQFEDKVWCLLQSMGFKFMSKDRKFKLNYGKEDGENKQIDIFAHDDEVAIVVECKSNRKNNRKNKNLKETIEATNGIREGLIKHIKKITRNNDIKVAFLLATENTKLIDNDKSRAKNSSSNIQLFSEKDVVYYENLVKHLGSAARYQFMGDLFTGQAIKALDTKVYAIKTTLSTKKPEIICYSFTIDAERLLKLGYVLHHSRPGDDSISYQRLISKNRLKKIREYVNKGGYFPNSIIVNIDKFSDSSFVSIKPQKNVNIPSNSRSEIGTLTLPKLYRSLFIIDGQHRVYSYSDNAKAAESAIPVIAFTGMDGDKQLDLFLDINENQKSISANLKITLEADSRWNSPNIQLAAKAVTNRVAIALGVNEKSPLYGKIRIGEEGTAVLKRITLLSITNAISATNLIGKFDAKKVKRAGHFYYGTNENQWEDAKNKCYEFLYHYFNIFKNKCSKEWDRDQKDLGVLLNSPDGISGLILILDDIIEHMNKGYRSSIDRDNLTDFFKDCEPFINIIASRINDMSNSERKSIRNERGNDAPKVVRNTYRRAIKEEIKEFKPANYDEDDAAEKRKLMAEGYRLSTEIEENLNKELKNFINKKNWGVTNTIANLPEEVFNAATARMKSRTYLDDQDESANYVLENLDIGSYIKILNAKGFEELHQKFAISTCR
jgi:DNA sulfur modification protein DndB